MNNLVRNFREKYRVMPAGPFDNKIEGVIIRTLSEILNSNDAKEIKEYEEQIQDRINGLKFIFRNFEDNMWELEQREKFGSRSTESPRINNYESALDRILLGRIEEALDKMPEKESVRCAFGRGSDHNKFLCQIGDRRCRMALIFNDFSGNMSFLHEKEAQRKDNRSRIHEFY